MATAKWRLLLRVDVLILLAAALVFTLWPQLDLWISGYFYEPDSGFVYKNASIPVLVYHGVRVLTTVAFFGLLIAVVWNMSRHQARLRSWRFSFLFLLLALITGPGLLVNIVFKDHWGRARPETVQEFGGKREFSPALTPSSSCDTNCSFVCGHASSGFVLMALGFVFVRQRRLWLLTGILAGGLVGLVRVMQGGHFTSDVIFSGLVVWGGLLLLEQFFRWRGWPVSAPPGSAQ